MAGQAGVLTGDNVRKLFEYAKANKVRLATHRTLVHYTDYLFAL